MLKWWRWLFQKSESDRLLIEQAQTIKALNDALVLTGAQLEKEKRARSLDVAVLVTYAGGDIDIPKEVISSIYSSEGRWRVDIEDGEEYVTVRLLAVDDEGPGEQECR